MKSPKILPTIVALILLASANITHAADAATIVPEKLTEIKRLIKLTKVDEMIQQNLDVRRKQFNQQQPGNDVFYETFNRLAQETKFSDLITPLYDKYYTLDDLRALNAFYDSPAGIKFLSVTPQFSREMTDITIQWSTELLQKTREEVAKKKTNATLQTPTSAKTDQP